ncbi:MAG: hypothetical protein Q4A65_00650 [Bacillota bacterium]|nr:hypothetical protein [Bacillota bacterium]
MVTTKKKVLSYVLSFIMAFTVFGVFGAVQANAEVEEGGYYVTVSYTNDDGATFEGTKTVKEYTKAEFEALADIGSESDPAIYMWYKNPTASVNVYKVTKGVSYEAIINDAGYSVGDLFGVYNWDGEKHYKFGNFIDRLNGTSPVGTYLDLKYDSATGSYNWGEPTAVKPVLALEYKYLNGGVMNYPDTAIADIEAANWVDDVDRSFLGIKDTTTDTGGMQSMSGARTGLDLVLPFDETIDVNGETIYFDSENAAMTVALPATFADKSITGWSYVKKVDGVDTVVDLGLQPTGAQLAEVGDATLFPTPKTTDDEAVVPSVQISKIAVAKKAFTVTYGVDGDAAGVQVAYQLKGKSAWKTVNVENLTTKKIKKLKKGKKYNVKVRAYYYTPKQAKAFGEWSDVVITKKIK